ncbi:MAG: hypothetical protein WBO10_08280 [Pyrinomonadaceae bacterium]
MIKNKVNLLLIILILLIPVLACQQIANVGKEVSNAGSDEPTTNSDKPKEWKIYGLDGTDISLELPGEPSDKSPQPEQLPASYKAIFSSMRIYALDKPTFSVSATELAPTDKRKWQIKDLADTSMAAMKRQLPGLNYTLDISSETKAIYSGSFSKNGKDYELRGCCIYKKNDTARVWAIISFYQKGSEEAKSSVERAIDSVAFNGTSEVCK